MKLVLDENLSAGLKSRLADLCSDIAHVKDLGLLSADDAEVWRLARSEGYTIVSKDKDFRDRLSILGYPPKVILIELGNCTVAATADALRRAWPFVVRLHENEDASLLLISAESAFLLLETNRD